MARTPELNLTPELPEVRSEDFNLFYKPEAEPLPQGLKEFANSLDRFVNDGLVDAVVLSEKKKKKEGEAQAEKDYKTGKKIDTKEIEKEQKYNKLSFFKKSGKGELPKEANPYYLDKYQELTLNSKADAFKQHISTKYAEKKVAENPSPTAFDDFYKDELKLFIAENQLGSYDAIMLEKGFFSKTSQTKYNLLQSHVSAQMSRISDEFDTNFINGFQGLFDKNKTMEENGKAITNYFSQYDDILSNGTKRKLFFDGLMDYADKTGDYAYAKEILSKLPKHVKLGKGQTDVIGNVKGLEDDFQEIKDKLQEREDQELSDDNTRTQNKLLKESLEATDFTNEHLTLTDAMKTPQWNTFSEYKKNEIRKVYKGKTIGFNTQTSMEVKDEIIDLLSKNKIKEAQEYLNSNMTNVSETYYNETNELLREHEISGNDGLLSTPSYEYFANQIDNIQLDYDRAFKQTGIKMDYNPFMKVQFKQDAISWLANNPVKEGFTHADRKIKFREYLKGEMKELKEQSLSQIDKVVSNFQTNEVNASKEELKNNNNEKKVIINNEKVDEGSQKTKKVDNNTDITAMSKSDLENRLAFLKTQQKRKNIKDEIKLIETELEKR
tara:strand:- start:5075 stop:6898 length:1824 start_codon:yes stop_codon:yes gene_type:complete